MIAPRGSFAALHSGTDARSSTPVTLPSSIRRAKSVAVTLFVIDENEDVVNKLKAEGTEALAANGVTSLQYANLGKARCLLVAVPENFEAGQIVEQARAISPGLLIFARGHSEAEKAHLESCGADGVVLGEEEIAGAMLRFYWTATERAPENV